MSGGHQGLASPIAALVDPLLLLVSLGADFLNFRCPPGSENSKNPRLAGAFAPIFHILVACRPPKSEKSGQTRAEGVATPLASSSGAGRLAPASSIGSKYIT